MHYTVIVNSILFGLGLAFESFMVALANGLSNGKMSVINAVGYAVLFAVCHIAAFVIGYFAVSALSEMANVIEPYLSWIAVGVLMILGVKMIWEGIQYRKHRKIKTAVKPVEFVVQSVVAALDAFAVGLTVAAYTTSAIVLCACVMGFVIFTFYLAGITVGRRFGSKFADSAGIIGGVVFIVIAFEIAVETLIN